MLFDCNKMNRQRNGSANKNKSSREEKLGRVMSERKKFETDYSNMTSPRSENERQKDIPRRTHRAQKLEQQILNNNYSDKSNSQAEKINLLFKSVDKNNKGYLDISEFQSLIEKCGYQINITTCRGIFRQIKEINKPGIYYTDIIQLLNVDDYSADTERDMKIAFQVYDKKKVGAFTFQEYKAVANIMKHKFSQQEMKKAFDLMDQDRDGQVSYQEFRVAMQTP